jgi:DNA-binding NarL/FixJ family response regulator
MDRREVDMTAATGPNLSVAIACRDSTVRRRIRTAVVAEGMSVVLEVGDAPQLPEKCAQERPDVVVIALDGKSDRGEFVKLLAERLPDARIVIVSAELNGEGWKDLEAGADGIVLESRIELALPVAISAVVAGQVTLPGEIKARLAHPALSFREKQILGLVTLGLANAEIASKLHLAESTVKSHLSSAFSKLGVRSRSEAAALILDPNGPLGPGILTISGDDELPVPQYA